MNLSPKMVKLLTIDEVEDHLKFNRFIHTGYRPNLGHWRSIFSVFELHNETGNIWFHLFPLIHLIKLSFNPWEGAPVYFFIAIGPCIMCLFCSVMYHLLMSSSNKRFYDTLLFVDYMSVFNTMVWPELMVIGWSFSCHSRLQSLCFSVYFVISLSMLFLALKATTVKSRLIPFAVQSGMRLVILVVRIVVGKKCIEAVGFYLAVEVLGSSGGLLNGLRAPERLAPGRFDLLFNSHQLMHLLTAAAQVCVLLGGRADRACWAAAAC